MDAQCQAGEDMCSNWEGDEEGLEGEGLVVGAGEEEEGF